MSDALGLTAQPCETISRSKENHLRRTLARISELVSENDIGLIVLGKPVHMDGSEGERVAMVRAFAEKLETRIQIPVVYCDERLTTVEADGVLEELGIPKAERKKKIDAVAAAIILRDYMNQEALRHTDKSGEAGL